MANEDKIYEQIEKSAGFYQPAVYELLSFYQSLENEPDPLDGQFIPMTTVQSRSPDQTKIFAVGLIPPSSKVTGKLLDRSASISAASQEDLEDEDYPDYPPQTLVVRPGAGLVESGRLLSAFGTRQNDRDTAPRPHLGCDIAAPAGSEIRAAKDGVVISISADGVRFGYGNTIIIEHADGQGSLYAHLGSFAAGIHVGSMIRGGQVVGFVGQTSLPHHMNSGPHLHFEVLSSIARGGAAKFDGVVVNASRPQRLEPQKWLSEQGRALASAQEAGEAPPFQATFNADAEPSTGWAVEGSTNANQASRTASQVANRDLNQTGLGRQFQAAQQAMINMMTAALERMANTPPLRLLVNPQSFKVSAEKLIAEGSWGRNGPITEHWGDIQDKIEGSGKVAGFYSMDAQNANGPGLNRTARQFSASYQNLLALWLIYKNNGGVWFPDPIVPTESRIQNLAVVGSVYLYYDEILYVGSFDTFTLTEASDTPFTLEYSFSFTVRSWYVLDHQDDPQYMYGRPGAPAPTIPTGTGDSPFAGGNNPQPSPEVALPPSVTDDPLGDFDDLDNTLGL